MKRKPKAKPPRKKAAAPKGQKKAKKPAANEQQQKGSTPAAEDQEPEDLSAAPLEIYTAKGEQVFGRPPIDVDLNKLEELAAMDATYEEIGAVLGISSKTVSRRMADDELFIAAYERGRGRGKVTLRHALWVNARRGNVAAQIFLAKQPRLLGYVDKVDQQVNGGEPIKHIITWKVIPAEAFQRPAPIGPKAEELDD